jgi:hypothetical protein
VQNRWTPNEGDTIWKILAVIVTLPLRRKTDLLQSDIVYFSINMSKRERERERERERLTQ